MFKLKRNNIQLPRFSQLVIRGHVFFSLSRFFIDSDANYLLFFAPQGGHSENIPTDPFTISKPQNPSIDVTLLHKIRRSTDLESLELWKGSSSRWPLLFIDPGAVLGNPFHWGWWFSARGRCLVRGHVASGLAGEGEMLLLLLVRPACGQ